ncbi:aminotransferase class V-fold PLP-dependent enzyme [Lentisphaerota bacterium ZTH]|nr:aminotransferase class V-fold PLP-dependent enzyme [Lentisphaerota bacterium]WET07064.1 aminotransferase class V-fold PLP-dependent enzyme [Lentisphaerota bacterium ZTH]
MDRELKTRIYFDNAASAVPDSHILGISYEYASRWYANQEAAHDLAYELRQLLSDAADRISKALTGNVEEVFFGSCGTDLFRLLSSFEYFKDGNILTTELEHPALHAAMQRTGAEVRVLRLKNGRIDLEHLKQEADRNTRLLAIHHVQSETGIIQDLAAIGEAFRKSAPQALFLADTIQSAGKIPIPWEKSGLDIISTSGHKLGSPGGAALVMRKNSQQAAKLAAWLESCRKEQYLAGRPEPSAAITLSRCIEKRCLEMKASFKKMQQINDFLRKGLSRKPLPNHQKIKYTASPENSSPYILHFIAPGYQSGVLVRMLSKHGVYFSAGSACQAETDRPSQALTALGFNRSDAFSGIRLSFSPQSTMREAERFIEIFLMALKEY